MFFSGSEFQFTAVSSTRAADKDFDEPILLVGYLALFSSLLNYRI
jgi:hypothetical protein